ncbi:hypothetical protein ACJMK2_032777 [Sinanodonta woodiana]|uniref:RING-type domain-containing protein n=1 Tax=Sinanodonta woodiana TaxID=1069815 RepID=A0ABD3X4A5_SINWO
MAVQMQAFEGEFTCGVCLEFYDTPVMLSCGHNFCKKCIQGIVNNNNRDTFRSLNFMLFNIHCPLCQCRQDFRHLTVDQLPVNRTLESIIDLYKKHSPTDIFDLAWNLDMPINYIQCQQHKLPQERYCEPCGVAICPKCEVLHHEDSKRRSKHGVKDLKDVAHHHQADIASILNEIKKKSLYLNEQIHLQADVLSNVQENQAQVDKELDQTFSRLMSIIRQKQDALRRNVTADLAKLKDPLENEQRKLKKLRTMLQELMKSLANIKRNKDMTHQIKKMKDIKKQLHSLLCFDFAWNLSERTVPTIDLPQWNLIGLTETEAAIQGLHWRGNASSGPKPRCMDTGCQTDFSDSGKEPLNKLKSKDNPIHSQGQTAKVLSSASLVSDTPQPSNMKKKMSDQSSAAFTMNGDANSSFTFMSPPTVMLHSKVPATSFTNSFSIPKNWSKNMSVTENMSITAGSTVEGLGNQTRVAFPKTAKQNGIPSAKSKGFIPTAVKQDGLPESKTPSYIQRAATQNDIPASKTQGFVPTTDLQDGIPSAKTPAGLATLSGGLPSGRAKSAVPSSTFPSGLQVTISSLASNSLATTTAPSDLSIPVTPSGITTTSNGLHMTALSDGLLTAATLDGLLTPGNSTTAAMPDELQTTTTPVNLPTTATPITLPTASEPFAAATGRQLTDVSSQSNAYNSDVGTISGRINALQITVGNPQHIKESKSEIPQRSPPFTFESYQKIKHTSQSDSIEDERLRESSVKTLSSVMQQTTNISHNDGSEINLGSVSTDPVTSNHINGSMSADNAIIVSNKSVTTEINAGGAVSNYVDTKSSTGKPSDYSNNTQFLVLPSGQEVSAAEAPVSLPNMYLPFSSASDKGTKASTESLVAINSGIEEIDVSSNSGNQTSTLPGTSQRLSTHSVQNGAKPSRSEASSLGNQIGQHGYQTSVNTSLTDDQNAQQDATSLQLSSINLYQSGTNSFLTLAETSLTSDNEISQYGLASTFPSLNEPENQYGKRNPESSLSRENTTTEHQSSLKMGKGHESTFSKQPISVSLNFFSEDEGRKILKAKRKPAKSKQK